MTEVSLYAFVYKLFHDRLFHKYFSSIARTNLQTIGEKSSWNSLQTNADKFTSVIFVHKTLHSIEHSSRIKLNYITHCNSFWWRWLPLETCILYDIYASLESTMLEISFNYTLLLFCWLYLSCFCVKPYQCSDLYWAALEIFVIPWVWKSITSKTFVIKLFVHHFRLFRSQNKHLLGLIGFCFLWHLIEFVFAGVFKYV